MLLPRIVSAVLALRQVIVPEDYCQPQCPACKQNIIEFDTATSCQPGSVFFTNCGSCQICVTTYALRNGTVNLLSEVMATLAGQLGRCDDTSGKGEVSAIASQVSAFSVLDSQLAATRTSNILITSTPTATGTSNPDSASKSSAYSAASAASAASVAASPTANASSPSGSGDSSVGPGPKLSQTWIAGPVIGSILGMTTVFLVIFCTRRRQAREEWELGNIKEISEDDQEAVTKPPTAKLAEEAEGKAMLHSDCVPLKEMDNTEVIAPVEMAALEPVGMELLAPREKNDYAKDWPLPISPLPALFAMTELRDERTGANSPKHDTFYHA